MVSDGTRNDKASDPAGQFLSGVDRIQTNAKWLLAVFAAVAGVLMAGIQLSSLGKLAFGERLYIALGAAAIALALIGAIIAFVVYVIAPRYMTLESLITLAAKRTWSGKEGTERKEFKFIAEAQLLGSRYLDLKDLKAAYEKAGNAKEIQATYDHIRVVLAGVLYERVRLAFIRSAKAMLVCATGAAISIGVFAWSANPPTSPSEFSPPVEAYVSLSPAGQQELAASAGAACVQVPIKVIVLSNDGQVADVLVEPTTNCKLTRFSVGKSPLAVDGTLTPSP